VGRRTAARRPATRRRLLLRGVRLLVVVVLLFRLRLVVLLGLGLLFRLVLGLVEIVKQVERGELKQDPRNITELRLN